MKKLSFLAVLALLMMFGCSKEEMTNTDQELFSVEKNNQSVIGEKRGLGNPDAFGSEIKFYFKSDITSIPIDCLKPYKFPITGKVEGKIHGYGIINPNSSFYNVINCEKVTDVRELWGEKDKYNIEITATVFITVNDSFNIHLNGNFYPWFVNPPYGYPCGSFEQISCTTLGGKGKFEDFNNIDFDVRGGLRGINLETGEMILSIFKL